MKTIKFLVVAIVTVAFFALQACDKHTCPTYSKTTTEQNTQRV